MTSNEIRNGKSLYRKKASVRKRRPFPMTTFMMLPNDLVLNCLARVSRSYYPIISLASKRLRSLLVSTELYQTRTLLGCTETCLYVCLKLPTYYSRQHWFTLCRRPNNSSCKKLVLVPILLVRTSRISQGLALRFMPLADDS